MNKIEQIYKSELRKAFNEAYVQPETMRVMTLEEFEKCKEPPIDLWVEKNTTGFQPGDMLVSHKGSVVFLVGIVESQKKMDFLKRYWVDKYNIQIQNRQDVAQVQYPMGGKIYDYPIEMLRLRDASWRKKFTISKKDVGGLEDIL